MTGAVILALTVGAGVTVAQSAAPSAADAFAAVEPVLRDLLLTDHENGEVLGTALDLVEGVLGAEPTADGLWRVRVWLAPGATDRLRRASEFEREAQPVVLDGYELRYRRRDGPVLRFLVGADRSRGVIELSASR